MYNQRWVIMFVLQKALHSPPGTLRAHSMLHNTGGRSGESLVTSQKERARERESICLFTYREECCLHVPACTLCICERDKFEQTINYRMFSPDAY